MKDVTDVVSYSWTNTKSFAKVDQSSSITSGTANLILLDADGNEVFNSPIVSSGTSTSSPAGTPGVWTITFSLEGVDGSIEFDIIRE